MRICVEQVYHLVDQIIKQFDQDGDDQLNQKQLTRYLQMAKKARGSPQKITDQEISEVLEELGVSGKRSIGRKELYLAVVRSTVDTE